ncbi:zinc transporter ZupT [Candidatus Saccharibacteria bacterium]|nr:MAG: zinc transporter ZupT [Candidatus Saccharibacteria bacterium]
MVLALVLATLAGLATSIGGLMATHKKVRERKWLAVSLAFAAGAMLMVSFAEMLPVGVESLAATMDHRTAQIWAYVAFFGGVALVLIIDRLLPKSLNPSEVEGREDKLSKSEKVNNRRLIRSGLLVALVLALHNFPEGMSTFIATYQDPALGLTLAFAIAIHNIPEGIAVAAPIYAATKSRKKAFWWSTISGLTEPLGALVALALISTVLPESLFGILYGLVAGMMVFVAIDEMLPAARRYMTNTHQIVYGTIAGMVIVSLSLVML